MTIENRLFTVLFRADRERHIKIDNEACEKCLNKSCTFICPAGCYQLVENKIEYFYEGCLECGACRLVCDREAIEWKYPRGGFGVCYRYG